MFDYELFDHKFWNFCLNSKIAEFTFLTVGLVLRSKYIIRWISSKIAVSLQMKYSVIVQFTVWDGCLSSKQFILDFVRFNWSQSLKNTHIFKKNWRFFTNSWEFQPFWVKFIQFWTKNLTNKFWIKIQLARSLLYYTP
jgi:hypothetical protein